MCLYHSLGVRVDLFCNCRSDERIPFFCKGDLGSRREITLGCRGRSKDDYINLIKYETRTCRGRSKENGMDLSLYRGLLFIVGGWGPCTGGSK